MNDDLNRPQLRVFVSSPSDVNQERVIAKRVVERLAREFYYFFDVQPVLWEREPLIATEHFQTMITPPHKTEIVLCVLWSRLGTPLPEDQFRGAVSRKSVTGTEWEFEDAVQSYRARGTPDILVYRKRIPVTAYIDDANRLEEAIAQKRRLDDFINRWLVAEDGSFKVASHDFSTTTDFAEIVETHLRELLSKRLPNKRGEIGLTAPPIAWTQGSPYRGLASFGPEHVRVFFGRARARDELREALVGQAARGRGFVLVLGASGSGKSSLVKAGLIPDVTIPGMAGHIGLMRWCVFRPSETQEDVIHGLASALFSETALPELRDVGQGPGVLAAAFGQAPALAIPSIRAALARAGEAARLTALGEPRLLVVVDQMEELFTLSTVDDTTRKAFARLLSVLAHSGRIGEDAGPSPSHGDLVWVVGTMRSDFYHRLAEIPDLVNLAEGQGQYHLLPPRVEELGQIIRGPAREAGLTFEVNAEGIGLDAVLQEAASHGTGALPLLEFTLDELYEGSAGARLLTYRAYSALGGLPGSIGRRAEHVYQALAPEVQQALPAVFRSLVTVDLGEDVAMAKAVPRDAVTTTGERRLLVDALVRARLLVSEARQNQPPTLRVAHEALLDHWPRVRELIVADHEFLQERARLRSAVELWQRERRSQERLLPAGKALAEAEETLEKRRDDLEPGVIDYIRESGNVARQRQRRRLRLAVSAAVVFAVLGVAAAAGGWIAHIRGQEARDQADLAMARQLAAESELQRQSAVTTEESALLALESLRRSPTSAGGRVVLKVLALLPKSEPIVAHQGAVRALAISADGRLLATGGSDGWARVWNLKTNQEVRRIYHGNRIEVLSLHPEGAYLATGGSDGQAILWEVGSGNEVYRYRTSTIKREYLSLGAPESSKEKMERAEITALTFSHDGQYLAAAGADGILHLADVSTRRPLLTENFESPISHIAFSPDDRSIAALSGRRVVLWDLAAGQQLGVIRLEGIADDLSFDRKGRYVAAAASSGAVSLWGVRDQQHLGDFLHDKNVSQVRFHPDGSSLWSTSADGTIRQWELETRRERIRIYNGGWVRLLAISANGKYIATADRGNVVRLWSSSDGSELARFSHEAPIAVLAFSPDTDLLAVASTDGVVRSWKLHGGSPVLDLGRPDNVRHLSFSEDGSILVTVGLDRVNTWQLPDGSGLGTFRFPVVGNAASVSSDNAHLIATSRDLVWIRAMDSGEVVREIRLDGVDLSKERGYSVRDVHIAKNGRWILKAINDVHRVWEISDGRATLRKVLPASVRLAAFSSDSTRLITVSRESGAEKDQVEVLDLDSGERLASWVSPDPILSIVLSPDTRFIAVPQTAYTRGWTIWKGATTLHLPSSSISIQHLTTGEPASRITVPNVAVPKTRIETMTFSPDGKYLAAGLTDRSASVVRVDNSEEVIRLEHGAKIEALAFSPDQRYLAMAGENGVRLYHWRIDDLYVETCARVTRNLAYTEWTKYFGQEPYGITCANLPPHPSLLRQARLLAEVGQVDDARVLLHRALRLGETIEGDPNAWIAGAAAPGLVKRALDLARAGRVDEALSALTEAKRHDPSVEITAQTWNAVCWQGALRQVPKTVIDACNRAVELAPENGANYDSRGIVRALQGDYVGAIADFEAFLAWGPQHERSEEALAKRRDWIESLKRGQNPLDRDTLKRLQEPALKSDRPEK